MKMAMESKSKATHRRDNPYIRVATILNPTLPIPNAFLLPMSAILKAPEAQSAIQRLNILRNAKNPKANRDHPTRHERASKLDEHNPEVLRDNPEPNAAQS